LFASTGVLPLAAQSVSDGTTWHCVLAFGFAGLLVVLVSLSGAGSLRLCGWSACGFVLSGCLGLWLEG